MNLEDGRFYRTRDNRVAGPMVRRLGRTFRWEGAIDGTEGSHNWTDGGHYLPSGAHHIWDLVDVAHQAANKAIDQMTLADYRRGVARLRGTL